MSLKDTIQKLVANAVQQAVQQVATQLTADVMTAMQNCPITELGYTINLTPDHRTKGPMRALVGKPRKTSKRTRRTAEDITATAKAIVAYVKDYPNVGADSIRKGLKIAKNEWLQPLALALTMGLKKTGSKRTTTYYVGAKTTSKKAIKTASASAKQTDLFETPDLPAVTNNVPVTNGAAIDGQAPAQA